MIDPTKLSFSQAQGYEPLPQPLQLEEISAEARTHLWNVFYVSFHSFAPYEPAWWPNILVAAHTDFFNEPLDELGGFSLDRYRCLILDGHFRVVFDFLTFLMRHPDCPEDLISEVARIFRDFQLAYTLQVDYPPTVYPAATPHEGQTIVDAVNLLKKHELNGARRHLMQSSAFVNQGNWAKSVHESICAVETVAKRIAPGTKTLHDALKKLEKAGLIKHPALVQGFDKIYGYTSDEEGVRHSLSDQDQPNVGRDEAVFMLGACASFASYLWRKHLASP